MAARPALIRDLVCYLRSRASPWSAYFHFKNLCAQRLTTGGHYLVLRGPFAGMAIGRQGSGMQLPMLVGSYEMEIWPFLESMERAGFGAAFISGPPTATSRSASPGNFITK